MAANAKGKTTTGKTATPDKIKTIGVLTSGGDAPGMNAAVRAIVRSALAKNIRVKGIHGGYEGLMHKTIGTGAAKRDSIVEMNIHSVSNIIGRGGTILHSARSKEFNTPKGVEKGARRCRQEGIDGLIVIGGDGTFRGAGDLSQHGIKTIGIPGTIDNDIPSTDFTLGYDTALNTIIESVDRLRDTMEAHHRCSVVEVMGNKCGDLALNSAIATGAVAVLIPEVSHNLDKDVVARIKKSMRTGKRHFIVIVAEGVTGTRSNETSVRSAAEIAAYIEMHTEIESRATVIGHVQRGGSPTARDRILAAQMGYYAVDLLLGGKSQQVVAIRDNKITNLAFDVALTMKSEVDKKLLKIVNQISI
ncbi:MAG: ATP-dependent 6-phosphofructokinase [Oscillospiraceae bacterium]